MNQIATLPLSSRHRMSVSVGPLPLKFPIPTIDQLVGAEPRLSVAGGNTPLISHSPTLPLVSRQSKSGLPSPSQSRCPTIDQTVGVAPIPADCLSWAPFISHIATLPLV